MHPQADFAANLQLRHPREHVQRVGDPAIRAVFEGDDAVVDMPAVDFLEHGGDVGHAHVLGGPAEAIDGGQVTKRILRPEKGDLLHALQRAGTADDFAVNGPNGDFRQRPLAGAKHVGKHFLLAGGREDAVVVLGLDLPDFRGQFGPFVDQFEDLQVKLVDLDSERLEVFGGRRTFRRGRITFARHSADSRRQL